MSSKYCWVVFRCAYSLPFSSTHLIPRVRSSRHRRQRGSRRRRGRYCSLSILASGPEKKHFHLQRLLHDHDALRLSLNPPSTYLRPSYTAPPPRPNPPIRVPTPPPPGFLSTNQWQWIQHFHAAMVAVEIETCSRCRECYFAMDPKRTVCHSCYLRDRRGYCWLWLHSSQCSQFHCGQELHSRRSSEAWRL